MGRKNKKQCPGTDESGGPPADSVAVHDDGAGAFEKQKKEKRGAKAKRPRSEISEPPEMPRPRRARGPGASPSSETGDSSASLLAKQIRRAGAFAGYDHHKTVSNRRVTVDAVTPKCMPQLYVDLLVTLLSEMVEDHVCNGKKPEAGCAWFNRRYTQERVSQSYLKGLAALRAWFETAPRDAMLFDGVIKRYGFRPGTQAGVWRNLAQGPGGGGGGGRQPLALRQDRRVRAGSADAAGPIGGQGPRGRMGGGRERGAQPLRRPGKGGRTCARTPGSGPSRLLSPGGPGSSGSPVPPPSSPPKGFGLRSAEPLRRRRLIGPSGRAIARARSKGPLTGTASITISSSGCRGLISKLTAWTPGLSPMLILQRCKGTSHSFSAPSSRQPLAAKATQTSLMMRATYPPL